MYLGGGSPAPGSPVHQRLQAAGPGTGELFSCRPPPLESGRTWNGSASGVGGLDRRRPGLGAAFPPARLGLHGPHRVDQPRNIRVGPAHRRVPRRSEAKRRHAPGLDLLAEPVGLDLQGGGDFLGRVDRHDAHFGAPFVPCLEPPFGGFGFCGFCLGVGEFLRPKLKTPITRPPVSTATGRGPCRASRPCGRCVRVGASGGLRACGGTCCGCCRA